MGLVSKLKTIIPLAATLVTMAYAQPSPGWTTLSEAVKLKRGDLFGQGLIAGFSGIRVDVPGGGHRGTDIDLFGTLNPVNFQHAPFTKVGGITRLSMEAISATQTFLRDIVKSVF